MRFRVLGPLQVEREGVFLDLGRAKQRALLALLVIHANEVLSSDRLIEELWDGEPPERAIEALQIQVSRLRRALTPALSERLEMRKPGYVLRVGDGEVDADLFERDLSAGRRMRLAGRPQAAAEQLRDALALWRGRAYGEFADHEFARVEAARLEELRLVAVEELAEARLALGQHHELAAELEALVAEHPLRERLWAARMLALYRSGRQAEALRVYGDLRRVLGEELGIEPSQALAALEEAVLLQRPELDWSPPPRQLHNLPASRSTFVGREDELAELEKLTETPGLVTIVGPGGAGKTRLALELARSVLDRYRDGVWLVELAPLSDPALVVEAVAAAVGVSEERGRPLVDTLAQALRAQHRLLILDNCEHLVGAAAGVAHALLRAAPELGIVATSREPLRVDGERVWRTPALAVPEGDDLPLEALLDYDAVRLFATRAADAEPQFALTAENAPAVAQLCRRLDGSALAIELAASRSRLLTPAQIVRGLDDRFSLLTTGARPAAARHQSLRAVVDWSYELLGEPERRLFARLAVFAGGFTLGAVEAVCADALLPAATLLDLLAALVDNSLVVRVHHEGEPRYVLLETLRHYAGERLVEAGEDDALRARHLGWAARLAEDARPRLKTAAAPAAFALLDGEHDNLRAALRWALDHDPEAGLGLAASLGFFWFIRGYYREGKSWLQDALARAPDAPTRMRACALRELGAIAGQQGDYDVLGPAADAALALFRELGEQAEIADALLLCATKPGDLAASRQLLEESLRVWRDAPSRRAFHASMDIVLSHLGNAARNEGDLVGARTYFEEAIAVGRELGDEAALALHLQGLGQLCEREGDDDGAGDCYRQSLTFARRVGFERQEETALLALGWLELRRGAAAPAAPLLAEVMLRARRTGDTIRTANALLLLARLATITGDDRWAAKALGVIEAMKRSSRVSISGAKLRAELEHRLGAPALATLLAVGGATALEQIVEEGLDLADRAASGRAVDGAGPLAVDAGGRGAVGAIP